MAGAVAYVTTCDVALGSYSDRTGDFLDTISRHALPPDNDNITGTPLLHAIVRAQFFSKTESTSKSHATFCITDMIRFLWHGHCLQFFQRTPADCCSLVTAARVDFQMLSLSNHAQFLKGEFGIPTPV